MIALAECLSWLGTVGCSRNPARSCYWLGCHGSGLLDAGRSVVVVHVARGAFVAFAVGTAAVGLEALWLSDHLASHCWNSLGQPLGCSWGWFGVLVD